MTRDAQQAIVALDSVLEKERQVLLKGDVDSIGDILNEKEALIDALTEMDRHDIQNVQGLKEKFARNQTLLDGALHGIRRTAARLAAIRQVRRSLETYDEKGQKRTIEGHVERKLERRA
ncbi:MAG: hypothetical protein AAF922_00300 [Pseudomonadota bacterium]